jgi:hypothetical protein
MQGNTLLQSSLPRIQRGQHPLEELIAAFSDLQVLILKDGLHAEVLEGLNPGSRMEIDRVDERAIHIEENGFRLWHA